MSETQNNLEAIFDAALELPAEERPAYLSRACSGNEALRRQVERLLRNLSRAGHFLTQGEQVASEPPVLEKPGDRIGRYKLLQQIGEGGCGVVYLAEQEEPVRRHVALKVIKLGMDTRSVIARFEAERQALAMMDHPNIAKVFDAGTTGSPHNVARASPPASSPGVSPGVRPGGETPPKPAGGDDCATLPAGRPYFVMELVRGVKITDFCDEKNLSTRERLELFSQVCHAIQHAHQKGIIHRDIKPSNVLVTVNDGVAVPKVIDFGIAKATTDQRLTDKTVFTAFEQFIGTPAYMSPEQAEITSVDVDTRSDIYSLGVLLYELLTGKTPFDAKELLQAGLDEMRRTIREKEPMRPSTKLTRERAARGLGSAKSEIRNPKSEIDQDLDWIVMRCLEKDRARRYETANGLASDIQRHLKNEPVVACPPSNLYRFQKLVRRNKLAFTAAIAVSAALIIGLGVSTWMFLQEKAAKQDQARLRHEAETARIRETDQRRQAQANESKAEAEANKSQRVVEFFEKMLEGVGPSVALGRDTTILREILDKAAVDISAELTNQPDVEIYLRYTIGTIYRQIGQLEKSEASLRLAVAAARKTGDPELGVDLSELGDTLNAQDRKEEAEIMYREALAIFKDLPDKKERDLMVAAQLDRLGTALRQQGKLAEAEPLILQALAMRREILGTNALPVARSLNNCALLLKEESKLGEAEAMLRESLEILAILARNHKPVDVDVLFTRYNLGVTLEHEGKLAEAEDLYRLCLEVAKRWVGDRPEALLEHANNISVYFYGLRAVLIKQGKLKQAEASQREALASLRNLADSLMLRNERENPDLLRSRGRVLARLGRWREAASDLTRARELSSAGQLVVWHELAALLVQEGELDAYRQHCLRSLDSFAGTKDLNAAHRIAMDCLILPASGADLATVAKMADTACTLGRSSGNYAWFQFCKALAEYRQGQFADAVGWIQKVLPDATDPKATAPIYPSLPGDPPEREVGAYAVLAMAHYGLKHTEHARAALAKGLEMADSKMAKPGEADLGYPWVDWIIAHALLREAKALVEGESPAANKRTETIKTHPK